MKSIDLAARLENTSIVFRAELFYSGKIKVSMYINLRKNQSIKSFSYKAGGPSGIYLNATKEYSKYTRMDFWLDWDKSIYSACEACIRVADSITSLVIE